MPLACRIKSLGPPAYGINLRIQRVGPYLRGEPIILRAGKPCLVLAGEN